MQSWYKTAFEYGIDIFMSMNAIFGNFKICEVGLGSKVHKPSAPNLGPMFLHVVGSAFFMITHNIGTIKEIDKVEDIPLFGLKELGNPQELEIDKESMQQKALEGYKEFSNLLRRSLTAENYNKIKQIFKAQKFGNLNSELWSKIVYDMIVAFKDKKSSREKLKVVESLRGIYFARFVSFIEQTANMTTEKAENIIKKQAEIFFENKDYFLEQLS